MTDVIHNTERNQFEIRDGEHLARLAYSEREGAIDLVHTEVAPAIEGQGIASELARTALEYAASRGLRVVPTCKFVRAYIDSHPVYAKLTAQKGA
jgi:predicted GNAT family acetyltransferase